MSKPASTADVWEARVESGNWNAIGADLNEYGGALLPRLLTDEEANEFRMMFLRDELFRSTIDMGRYRLERASTVISTLHTLRRSNA
jgi:hypothetical protein